MDDITVIIVEFNTLSLTRICVESLLAFYPTAKLIIVDNGSGDGSHKYILDVIDNHGGMAVVNNCNVGHGPGMHQALMLCETKYALMLDSDCCVLKGGWIEEMLKLADGTYMVGHLIHVNKRIIESATGELYMYPYRMLLDISKYKQLPPFIRHGAPCILNIRKALQMGYKLMQFGNSRLVGGDEFVTHQRGGTCFQWGIPGWHTDGVTSLEPERVMATEAILASVHTTVTRNIK